MFKKIINFILDKLFGKKCERCSKRKKSVDRRRVNTAYFEDELNFCIECKECFDITEKMWEDQWKDYNGGRL